MALIASTPMQCNYKFTHLPESNAVGTAGRSLRSSSEVELNDFVMGSMFWQRTYLFQKAYAQLYDLATLKGNWDSYGAPSPNPNAFDNALRILKFIQASDLEAMKIVPSAEGGIGSCFRRTDRYADIEVLNDGTILGVRYVGMETPVLIIVDGSDDSIRAGVEQIREHISA